MSGPLICFGELLLRLGAPGRQLLLQTPQFEVHVGGAEANVAVALARFGHSVRMLSVVPDNPLGAAAVGELRRHGVDTANVSVGAGRMGLYFLIPGALMRPAEVLYDRAGSAFATAAAQSYHWPQLLEGARGLHISGITPALGPETAAATLAAASVASACGIPVAFDSNYRSKLWDVWATQSGGAPARLRVIVAHCTLLFAVSRDIDLMLGTELQTRVEATDETAEFCAAAARAFAAFPRLEVMASTVRVVYSADHYALSGIMIRRGGDVILTPQMQLQSVVDRIGTGDAYAAGLWHGLLSGMDDAHALSFAIACAGLKHAIPGDLGLLSVAEVEHVLADGGNDVRR